jgi:hypothetical protein
MKKHEHAGQPTSFDPKYIPAIYKYMEEAVPENMQISTVEGFALTIDVTKKTLYNWSKKNKEFLHALKILKMKQREQLISIGIFGGKEINANIVALMLKVNHKMVEVQKTDITSKGKKILVMPSELIDKYDISQKSKGSSN